MSQASATLVDWLRAQKRFGRALDYGCGKLRYSGFLAENSKSLTVVDSRFQLEREQIIAGKSTTIRRYVRQTWRRTNVLEISEFLRCRSSYNFILCANVLSAIPSRSVRSQVLKSIRARLATNGRALFVVQFRNTSYRDLRKRREARRYLDGYLLRTWKGTFYYGLIPPTKLKRILTTAGFKVEESWIEGESAFVLTHK
jgi:2-polyprenyl-3-methyl-5-hydroxy-6-metoxy-1,4-benzoquinol methylase